MIKEFFKTNQKVILIVGLVATLSIATMCFVFAAKPKTTPINTGTISSDKYSSAESSSEIISSAPAFVVPDIKPTITTSSAPPASGKAVSSSPTTSKKEEKPLSVEGKVESKPAVSSKPVVPKVSSVPTPPPPPASSAPVSSVPPVSSQPVAPPPPASSEIDVVPPHTHTGEPQHGDKKPARDGGNGYGDYMYFHSGMNSYISECVFVCHKFGEHPELTDYDRRNDDTMFQFLQDGDSCPHSAGNFCGKYCARCNGTITQDDWQKHQNWHIKKGT